VANQTDSIVIIYLPQEWPTYHRRPHWLALAEHFQLLMIEPPAGLLTFWKKPKRVLDLLRGKRIRQGERGIFFYRPLLLASPGIDFLLPLLAKLDRFLMRRRLKKVIRRVSVENKQVVTIINHVHQYHFSKLLPNEICVYEVTDLYLLLPGQQQLDPDHWYTKKAVRCENEIVSKADVIISSSKLVYEKWRATHSSIHYLPNCADYDHFAKTADDSLAVPDELNAIVKPILGFVGYINHLIDFELLNKLAEVNDNWSIVIIGSEHRISGVHRDAAYQKSENYPNVHYLGFKPYDELPSYLKGFDVCLMPFRLNDWMRYSAPNKVYQYLAAGKSVVSTNFTEIEVVKDVIAVAENHQEFIDYVRSVIDGNSEEKIKRRQEVAREYSTEARAKKVATIINDAMNK
jgi:glycosyltransferase involved in cell wall biosynthesis